MVYDATATGKRGSSVSERRRAAEDGGLRRCKQPEGENEAAQFLAGPDSHLVTNTKCRIWSQLAALQETHCYTTTATTPSSSSLDPAFGARYYPVLC